MAKKVLLKTRKIGKSVPQTNVTKTTMNNMKMSSFEQERNYFSYGIVCCLHSEDMTVDVKLDNGIDLKRVPVRSSEWNGSDSSKGFGERDLPPKDSLVLIAFPFGTMEDSLVLCSAFSLFGKHSEKWKSELMTASKENEKLVIQSNGNKKTTNKDNGDITYDFVDGSTLTININGAKIEVDSSGKITINSDSASEIVLNDGTDWAVQYTALKSAFDQLKSDFNNLVTQFNLLAAHSHPVQVAPATGTGVTTGIVPVVTGTSSAADMSGAKVDDVRLP